MLCLALAGGAAVVIARRHVEPAAAAPQASLFKTATVTTGDLTTTERIDGVVELTSTLLVLHRIEGQASSGSSSASNAAPTPTSATKTPTSPQATGATNQNALASPVVADCPTPTVPGPPPAATVPSPTTTTIATADTVPVGTAPIDTAPATTVPPTTAPVTTTTTPQCDPNTTSTTVAAPGNDTTGALPTSRGGGGGGGGGGGATRTSASGSTASSAARVTQTITSVIAANAAVEPGDVLYTVDGAPVVALSGALPSWRSLSTSSADGADIGQLEASLVALGYDPAAKVTVDDHFDSATKSMVKAWQTGLGVAATGTVTLGSVVFLPASTTVSAVNVAVGSSVSDGDTVMTLASPSQQVLVDVPDGDEAKVVPGLAVKVGTVDGTVTRLRSADRNGTVVVEALIAPASAIENATNGTAVKVTLTLQDDAGVLIAPAAALVSRLDGTYAIEARAPDGSTKWLTVDLLGVSGGNVAIRGAEVAQGTVVLVPA